MALSKKQKWSFFINELPHHQLPYSKKNWGNSNHSLCSYQGKLKPSIAHFLVETFVPQNGRLLDPFCGVGTIPFEAALGNKISYGIDISPLAYIVSSAKVHRCDRMACYEYLYQMSEYIRTHTVSEEYKKVHSQFGLNKKLADYYNPETFLEILLARMFIINTPPVTAEQMLVVASLLHILHGNRPYALSRKSHPIIPYAPTGEFVYKNLIAKVTIKLEKSLDVLPNRGFKDGKIFLGDSTQKWDDEINEVDAIITSPPFYDSTRFYSANWIRLWFTGWNADNFSSEPAKYIDERQKKDFDVYDSIFEQAKERLKRSGFFVMHLGKSDKCNMGQILQEKSKRWFSHSELFTENVENCAKFGIHDLGSVTDHQYLVMH
jgi:methylase of polypeptide subunit release factors